MNKRRKSQLSSLEIENILKLVSVYGKDHNKVQFRRELENFIIDTKRKSKKLSEKNNVFSKEKRAELAIEIFKNIKFDIFLSDKRAVIKVIYEYVDLLIELY